LGVLFRRPSSEHGRARARRGNPGSVPFLSPVWCASALPRPGEAEALANGVVGDPVHRTFSASPCKRAAARLCRRRARSAVQAAAIFYLGWFAFSR
jgi:hypothetical protein